MKHPDFLVVGGGIVGLSVARALKRRFADCRVELIEKENRVGEHASGRNSGVLHAGFYYSPDSLKARFTRDGNRAWTAYCEAKGLPLLKCGKLVVAKDESEHRGLDELLARGKRNGIELVEVDEAQARAIEPRVKTCARALYSPSTASVDPLKVLEAVRADAVREGVAVRLGVEFRGRSAQGVRTSAGEIPAGYVVNAAGLYADRIAHAFGFARRYRILPFKGLYLYSDEPPGAMRTHIYPVPDLRNPFLGVHFTLTVDGHVKIGPTAIPAFWRENYRGFDRFRTGELADICYRQARLFLRSGFDFKRLALEEFRKHSRAVMVGLASALAHGIDPRHYRRWGKPGIRAQLLDLERETLEMDFVLEGDARSFHVLNAVSPAFTCALPFAEYVVAEIAARLDATPVRAAS